jgi:phosphatidate cytidylyltransferase
MKVRILTSLVIAIVGIPILLLCQTIAFPIAVSIVSARAIFEILRVIGANKNTYVMLPSYVMAVGLPFGAYFSSGGVMTYVSVLAVTLFIFLLYLFTFAIFTKGSLKFGEISEIFASVTYVTSSLSAMCALTHASGGIYTLILVFIGAWVCDISAYFVGITIGKHKLIPEISPKKTVEGSVGGIVFTSLAFVLYGFLVSAFTDYTPSYLMLAITGLIIPVVSQLGDLVASLIKREHGIKDYGKILPGHGGILDRFDSVIPVSMVLLIITENFPPFI